MKRSKIRLFVISIILGCIFICSYQEMTIWKLRLLIFAEKDEYLNFLISGGDYTAWDAEMARLWAQKSPESPFYEWPKVILAEKSWTKRNDERNDHSKNTKSGVVGKVGCKLSEHLKLRGPEIDHFFHPVEPLVCKTTQPDWIYMKESKIFINDDSLQIHGGYINCTYVGYERGKDDHELRTTRKLGDVASGSPVLDEVFRLHCKALDDETFESTYISPLPLTTETVQRVEKAMSDTKKRMNIINQPPPLNLNVYIIGFDSLSRLTFQRKLKQMFKYVTEDLNGVVMEGYNIVGDGTPQALIPILTGQTEVELPLTRKRFPDAQHVDVYPWVWNEFRENGYVTLYGEDSPSVGTFTYRLKGFLKQPTDYYMRTFHMVSEKFDGHPNGRWCFGNRSHHEVHFQYVKDFFDVTPRWAPKFAFQFHSAYSHDDLNAVEIADSYMVQHLKYFKENFMNNSVLIVMSDHGHRFSQLRATHQGKLEERLPMFSVVMPAWFEKQFPVHMKNLKTNSKRLTTPFDIHATLRQILHLNIQAEPKTARQIEDMEIMPRSLSLFDEIPPSRTCAQAHIEMHWCACLSWSPLSVEEPIVRRSVSALIKAINAETERERKLCAVLSLDRVIKAQRYMPDQKVMTFLKSKDLDGFEPEFSASSPNNVSVEYLEIDFSTKPGGAHYEASVTFDVRVNEIHINLDTVSHINAYGDRPHCVIDKDYFLATWCVCLDKI